MFITKVTAISFFLFSKIDIFIILKFPYVLIGTSVSNVFLLSKSVFLDELKCDIRMTGLNPIFLVWYPKHGFNKNIFIKTYVTILVHLYVFVGIM